jgi:hypothetical protein
MKFTDKLSALLAKAKKSKIAEIHLEILLRNHAKEIINLV